MKDYIFDYYYGNESEQFTFFRIPKLLFTNEKFASLSVEAKLLYGMMLDRMGLSMKNRWLDENNCVYIIFTVREMMDTMNCGEQKVSKMLKELDSKSGIGLIERKRRGLGKADIIYVKNFAERSVKPNNDNFEHEAYSNTEKYESTTADDIDGCSKNENDVADASSFSCEGICRENYSKAKPCTSEDCDSVVSDVQDILADEIQMQQVETGDGPTVLSENSDYDSDAVKDTVQEPRNSHFKNRENHGSRTSKFTF